ncbi:MAG: NAD(P)H-hydrate epimerase [Candidatus Eisenbacteria bacterium]
MKLVSQSQMQEMDRRTIAGGTPGSTLMERAGRGLLRSLLAHAPHLSARPIWILCGKGNNGGDGLVLARLLRDRGVHPRVLLLADRTSLTGDAALNADRAEAAGVLLRSPGPADLAALQTLAPEAIVVDALFGTGLSGAVRGPAAEWIERLGTTRARIMAVDLPSTGCGRSPRARLAVPAD